MLYDISTPLDEQTPVYPGDPQFMRRMETRVGENGAEYTMSSIVMSAHCGTHVDAPFHFFSSGLRIHEIPIHRWITPAIVIESSGQRLISAEQCARMDLRAGDAVLFKANAHRSADADANDFCAISVDAAEYLVSKNINLVGIDALSIEHYHDPLFPVHKKLLGAGVLILEGLRFSNVPPGRYTLLVAPLLIRDGDGAPARALLLDEDR